MQMKNKSPYLVRTINVMLSWHGHCLVDRPIGVSTAISRTAGMIASTVAPDHVARNAYFSKFRPVVDWEWMLVVGLALGAFISSRLSGDRATEPVERLWRARFG